MSNVFWDYSCTAYAMADVAQLCLKLQDTYGLDVNILLYAAWLASREEVLELEHLRALDAHVAPWRTEVVAPLRRLRREARERSGLSDSYAQLKAQELDAERQQQDSMYGFYGDHAPLPGGSEVMRENLQVVARYFCGTKQGWNECLERLSHLLSAAL